MSRSIALRSVLFTETFFTLKVKVEFGSEQNASF